MPLIIYFFKGLNHLQLLRECHTKFRGKEPEDIKQQIQFLKQIVLVLPHEKDSYTPSHGQRKAKELLKELILLDCDARITKWLFLGSPWVYFMHTEAGEKSTK